MEENVYVTSYEFYEWLESRGYREETIISYRKCLKKFLIYLLEETPIHRVEEITPEDIHKFQTYLYHLKVKEGHRLSMSTQLNVLSSMRQFFVFLTKTNRLLSDPSSGLKMPKRPERLPYVPSIEEISRLLRQPDCSTALGLRDRTILEVLYSTGIRAGELCRLKLYDVDICSNQVHIRGKGGKERLVPLGEIASDYLGEYLQIGRPALLVDKSIDAVFVSCNGRGLLRTDLCPMVFKYRKAALINHPLTPHSLRHACASHLLSSGCDIRYIQKLLGHASLLTTQVYTKVEVSDLKAVHQRCHPRERLCDEFE